MMPYYDDGTCVIYHGDCCELVDALPTPALVIADPPYDLVATGGGMARPGTRRHVDNIAGHLDMGFDMSILDRWDNWFCFCSKNQLVELLQKAEGDRWMLITWNKPNPTPFCNGNYLPDTEYIVHRFTGADRLFGDSSNDRSRFMVRPSVLNTSGHPSPKPIDLIQKLVRLGSRPGELILDPFMGSGTTLRAAKDLGRRAIGIEIEERYCEIAAKRLGQEVMVFE